MSSAELEELTKRNRSRYGASDDDAAAPSARTRAAKASGFALGEQEIL